MKGLHGARDPAGDRPGRLRIRPNGQQDADLLAAIIREAFADVAETFGLTAESCPRHPAFVRPENVREGLDKGVRFFLAEEDGRPVGCAGVGPAADGACELVRLAVLPAHRRRGIGSALVEHVLRQARAAGLSRVELHLIAAHEQLRRWYEKLGFASTGNWKPQRLPFVVTRMVHELKEAEP